MRNAILFVVAIVVVALVAARFTDATSVGTAEESNAKTSLSIALGKADFLTYCASCHGASGVGDGPVAEFLALEPANLTKLSRKNNGVFPRERIAAVIDGREAVKVHGPRDMPVWGDWFSVEADAPGLRAQERELVIQARIDALVRYIETIQEK
jgi:mono/diheme cytochrome c family protein